MYVCMYVCVLPFSWMMTSHSRAQTDADELYARQLQREEEEAAAASVMNRTSVSANAAAAAASSNDARVSPADADSDSSGSLLDSAKFIRDEHLKRLLNSPLNPRLSPNAGDEFAFYTNHICARVNRASISLSVILSGDVQRAILFNCQLITVDPTAADGM
jgi:hypothetical protein